MVSALAEGFEPPAVSLEEIRSCPLSYASNMERAGIELASPLREFTV